MIDLETKSDIDIAKSGVYRYADSPYFDILLFAYSVDDTPVQVVDLACGEQLPEEILNALTDDRIQKHAFNASFERVCLSVWLRRNYPERFVSYGSQEDACGNYLNPNAWRCTMVAAAYLGLPLSLAGVGAVLQLQQQKMSEGKALIRYFCVPYDTVNGIPVFHVPTDAPKKWDVFRAYNKRDVETEQAIEQKIARFPVPDFVWQEYALDQTINDRGIQLDLQLVQQAIRMDTLTKDKLLHLLKNLTDLDNPNSVQQMKQWLAEHGLELESLGKKEVQEQLKTAPPDLQAVLLLRQQVSKSSVKKYQAMQNAVCSDGRARGMFQFYGANRTGREAGRIIQLQNLPQNHLPDLEDARELVKSGDLEAVELLYEDVPDTLSQLIRTAFVPKPGYKFLVADFSAIEARVIAWFAGETWRMQAFADGKDIYCASASKIFGVPVVKHGINGHLRQKGKVAELACGYSGSVGAMKAMGGAEMSDTELKQIVTDWRTASPHIVQLWWDCSLPRKTQKTDTQNEKNAPEHHVQERFLLPINGISPMFLPVQFLINAGNVLQDLPQHISVLPSVQSVFSSIRRRSGCCTFCKSIQPRIFDNRRIIPIRIVQIHLADNAGNAAFPAVLPQPIMPGIGRSAHIHMREKHVIPAFYIVPDTAFQSRLERINCRIIPGRFQRTAKRLTQSICILQAFFFLNVKGNGILELLSIQNRQAHSSLLLRFCGSFGVAVPVRTAGDSKPFALAVVPCKLHIDLIGFFPKTCP